MNKDQPAFPVTPMTVEEGNKIIAGFMEIDFSKARYSYRPGTDEPLTLDHLRYHSSWDWLMPVVEKINKWHSDTMCEKMDFYLLNQSICSSKEMVWSGCIEFIQWYNSKEDKVK